MQMNMIANISILFCIGLFLNTSTSFSNENTFQIKFTPQAGCHILLLLLLFCLLCKSGIPMSIWKFHRFENDNRKKKNYNKKQSLKHSNEMRIRSIAFNVINTMTNRSEFA